jgi:hypothetical protein
MTAQSIQTLSPARIAAALILALVSPPTQLAPAIISRRRA